MNSARANRMKDELLGQSVGGWQLLDYIGFGKSALVFKAARDEQTAALKIFDPELVEKFGKDVQKQRIERELSLCGVTQPHLIRILDGGECSSSTHLFVAMEFINGPNLATVIEEIPQDCIWQIVSQVASVARFLEERRLAHRDIKTDNIVANSDFRHVTLLDLGVVRPFGVSDLTDDEDQRVFVATLRYSSPEYLLRAASDTLEGWRALTFYQLGALIHDMIMRKRLFSEFTNPFARLVEAVRIETPTIESPDASQDLILLARNCLCKDPELRLSLVNWDDFDQRASRPTSGDDAKERIQRRLLQAQNAEAGDTESRRLERGKRQTVARIQTMLMEIIRHECIGSGLFPPQEMKAEVEDNPNRSHVYVRFSDSAQHELGTPLHVCITVDLLDQRSEAVDVRCAACLSPAKLDPYPGDGSGACIFYRGVYQQEVIKTKLEGLLYLILDRAQQNLHGGGNANENEAIPLDLESLIEERESDE